MTKAQPVNYEIRTPGKGYEIRERKEPWGDRFDIYRDGILQATSEKKEHAEGFIEAREIAPTSMGN